MLGAVVDEALGTNDGRNEGMLDGCKLGITDGIWDGFAFGDKEGNSLGTLDGSSVSNVGLLVGETLGIDVYVGAIDG